MNLQTIESSVFLKHWMGQVIGPKMRKSHELYFQDKNEDKKLLRENEIAYYFQVISGMIDLQMKQSHIALSDLGFQLKIYDDQIEWIISDETLEFRDLFETLFKVIKSSEQKVVFTHFDS
ncbi:MAG: hypothetical protein KC646_02845 [Candidatus Cloacimonetes bacterium]|nr:hypothetical protein [Candidatus Cloacimonadota bacterium]